MNYFNPETITVRHDNNRRQCQCAFWQDLMRQLLLRGQQRHESGAFLLGHQVSGEIVHTVFYETLDPSVYDRGIVEFDGSRFSQLWAHCKQRRLSVLADIHTHPGSAHQSDSDRAHPMIGRRGHIAVIVPNYARHPLELARVGVYEYLSAGRWVDKPSPQISGENILF